MSTICHLPSLAEKARNPRSPSRRTGWWGMLVIPIFTQRGARWSRQGLDASGTRQPRMDLQRILSKAIVEPMYALYHPRDSCRKDCARRAVRMGHGAW